MELGPKDASSFEESRRLEALAKLSILDSLPEQSYDDVTELASFICGTPIALVSLVDRDRQWFKSSKGLSVSETPRSQSFCAHTIPSRDTLVVEDALKDARFSANPLVIGDPKIRFYAGAPVFAPGGEVLGTVCVIDSEPRVLSAAHISALKALAGQVTSLLAQRQMISDLRAEALRVARAEERLQQSEKTLALATDAAGIAAWFYDPVQGVVGGDEAMRRLFGMRTSAAATELWLAAIHKEDRERVAREFSAGIEGTLYDTEYRVDWTGSVRWVRAKARVTSMAGQRRMVGICEDITERKLSEEAFRVTANRLRLAQEAAHIAVWDWDMVSNTFIFDDAICELFGRPPEALQQPGPVFAVIHPEDRAMVEADITKALQPGGILQTEYRALRPDGSIRWIAGRGRVFRSPAGDPVRMTGVNTDITERRTAERIRENLTTQLEQILAATTDGVAMLDRNWNFVFLNDCGKQILTSKGDLLGKNAWEEFPAMIFAESPYIYHYQRAMHERIAGDFVAEYPEPLNITLQIFARPVSDGIIVIFRDITDQKRSERALIQNEKLAAVGRLASSIAHEINNPLEAVTNLLYLARITDQVAVIRGYLASADKELRRVSAITNQTLRFHRQSSSPIEVMAEDLVDSTFAIYESRFQNSRIDVQKRIRTARPVRCFDGEIRQVLSNLIVNAIDAMPAGGRLLFRSRQGHNWKTGHAGLIMTVADTGSGIPKSVAERVFEAFFTTKGIGGTGLGLWISKGILDRHHGSISLRSSQKPGSHGTVAMLFLPYS